MRELGGYHHIHSTEAKPKEGNKQQSQAQNSYFLAPSSGPVPVYPASQWVEGSMLVSDGSLGGERLPQVWSTLLSGREGKGGKYDLLSPPPTFSISLQGS